MQMTLSMKLRIPEGFEGKIRIGFAVHDGYTYKLETPSATYDEFAPKFPNYLMLKEHIILLHHDDDGFIDIDLDDIGNFVYGDNISVVAEIIEWPENTSRILFVEECIWSFDNDGTIAQNTGFGFHLNLGKNLPDILQKDFFKHCMFMRNIIVSSNYYDKIIYLNKFDKIFENWKLAKNWTSKVNEAGKKTLIQIPETYFKRNHFRETKNKKIKVTKCIKYP